MQTADCVTLEETPQFLNSAFKGFGGGGAAAMGRGNWALQPLPQGPLATLVYGCTITWQYDSLNVVRLTSLSIGVFFGPFCIATYSLVIFAIFVFIFFAIVETVATPFRGHIGFSPRMCRFLSYHVWGFL